MAKAKVLLISFSGEIATPSSLEPDNGLMNLASELLREGHSVEILDYGVVSTIEKLSTGYKGEKLRKAGQEVMADLRAGKKVSEEQFLYLTKLKKDLEGTEYNNLRKIGYEILEKISSYNPSLVGFKTWNGSGFTGVKLFSQLIKETDSSLKIALGGPHIDWWQEHILRELPNADVAIYGEGEPSITGLARWSVHEENISNIPNLIYRDNGSIRKTLEQRVLDLSSLNPLEATSEEVYPALFGDQKFLAFTVDDSRGCVHSCNFCVQPIKSGHRYRRNSPENLVSIMERYVNLFGTRVFRYAGSNTMSTHALKIAREVLKRELNISQSMFGEFGLFDRDSLRTLKTAGVNSIFYGLESGSSYIREKAFAKKFNNEEAKKTLSASRDLGIYTIASLIFPAPFETEKTRQETIEFIKETKPGSVPIVPAGIIYGTEWFKNPEKYNIELDPNYVSALMNYPIKLFYPGILWPPLPWKINGKDSSVLLKEHAKLSQELEKNGQETFISDELFQLFDVISKSTGQSLRELKEECQDDLLSGNFESMKKKIELFNKGARRINES